MWANVSEFNQFTDCPTFTVSGLGLGSVPEFSALLFGGFPFASHRLPLVLLIGGQFELMSNHHFLRKFFGKPESQDLFMFGFIDKRINRAFIHNTTVTD